VYGTSGGPLGSGGQATDRLGAVRPGKAPSISYMEGALFFSAFYSGRQWQVDREQREATIDHYRTADAECRTRSA